MGKVAALGSSIATGNPMPMIGQMMDGGPTGGGGGPTGGAAALQGGITKNVLMSGPELGGVAPPPNQLVSGGSGMAESGADKLKSVLSAMMQPQPMQQSGGTIPLETLLSKTQGLEKQFPKMSSGWGKFLQEQ